MTISFAKQLLKPENVLLNVLGRHFAFETAIGMNGVVWIRCADMLKSLLIRNAIQNCEKLKLDDIKTEAMVEVMIKQFRESNS